MATSILLTILAVALCISVIVNYYSFKSVFENLNSISEIFELTKQVNEILIAKVEKLEEKVKHD